jgi:50S ribosomal protein L16 3-hydroxylase
MASEAAPVQQPTPLLGGLTPAQFMRRHWHKKPLLIRQAIPGFAPLLSRPDLFALAADESVESRLIERRSDTDWSLRHGPFQRRQWPALKQPGWTLLVQGVDLHHDGARALMDRFRFVPDARLDDLMVSWASLGGGVGPHVDSYDVFLLQAQGRRRWQIGHQKDLSLQPDMPLRILQHFEPEQEWVLEPGDMLYLPPHWAHDGVSLDAECMTYSVGFRSPQRAGLAAELAQRMTEDHEDAVRYRDPRQAAVDHPAELPANLVAFGREALERLLGNGQALQLALGEVLTEPKPRVWFEEPLDEWQPGAVVLDRRTRMLYDDWHVFINGEALRAAGKDAQVLRRLADARRLDARSVRTGSRALQQVLADWHAAGWLHLLHEGAMNPP